jgi:hypothetical protein
MTKRGPCPECGQLPGHEMDCSHWGTPDLQCSCDSAGPDAFGNYDRIPNPDCPVHEA